jgi:acyl-CoA dehydrogenase
MFSSNAKRADWVVVIATLDPARGRDAHRAFVVERGTPGFEVTRVEDKLGVRADETCSFVLEDCRVPPDNLLGGEASYEGGDREAPMDAFDATGPLVAIEAVGIARAAFDIARDVVREHPHGGRRRLAALERLADARSAIATARLLCLRAAWLLDRREPNALEASLAKLYAPPAGLRAVVLAMEALGEAGVRRDRIVEKLYRDVKVIDLVEGTQQAQRSTAARLLVGLPGDA